MINVYISYAPADAPYVRELLRWLKPLEEQYFLRIWYNRPPPSPPQLPAPWQLLFFWYTPPGPRWPYHPDLPGKLEDGHIYLFVISHHTYQVHHIEHLEVPKAVERQQRFGEGYIRLYPVLASPSMWKQHSRLGGFAPLNPGRTIQESPHRERTYLEMMQRLRQDIEALRRNWMEEYKRLDMPLDDFHRPAPPEPPPPEEFVPLPGWAGWLILFFIFFSVGNWFVNTCASRTYRRWKLDPPALEKQPVEYPREIPYTLPEPVPLPRQDIFTAPVDTLVVPLDTPVID
jgi:hypothetical protein